MNNVLEYIYNHPKEIKRIIGTTDEQLIKLIENPQKVEKKKTGERQPRKKVNQGRRRKKKSLSKTEEIMLTLYYLYHVPTFQGGPVYVVISQYK